MEMEIKREVVGVAQWSNYICSALHNWLHWLLTADQQNAKIRSYANIESEIVPLQIRQNV